MAQLASSNFEHLESAIRDYNEAIRLNPDSAAAYLFRGLANRSLGDLEAAIQDFEDALLLNPNLGDILAFAWSMAYFDPVDPDAAIQEIETALSLVDADSVLAIILEAPLSLLRSGE